MGVDISRYRFFQDIHLWPTMSELNYEGWIENFDEGEERELAAQILAFFVYFPENMVNQLFRTVIGRVGTLFRALDPSWTDNSFKNDCWYSYIPGEVPHESDSGGLFARKVREVLDVDEQRRFMSCDKLIGLLRSSKTPQKVILTDDFVGSGSQCDNAWNSNDLYDDLDVSLKDVVAEGHHFVVYAPLVMNYVGADRILRKCEGLQLECIHLLGVEYDLFSSSCACWDGKEDRFKAGTEMLIRKSRELGIPENGDISIKGFCDQGLALAFSHGIPDACPALFFWESENWRPLKKKHLTRM